MINVILKWLGWFLLCVILQSTVVPYIAIMSVKPDLPMLALFFMATRFGMMHGVYAGFFLGLGHDLFAPGLLGQNALAMGIVGFISGIFNERVMRLDPIMRGVLIIVAFLVNDIILMLVQIMKSDADAGTLLMELLAVTLPRAAYSLLFAMIPFVWTNIIKPPRLVD